MSNGQRETAERPSRAVPFGPSVERGRCTDSEHGAPRADADSSNNRVVLADGGSRADDAESDDEGEASTDTGEGARGDGDSAADGGGNDVDAETVTTSDDDGRTDAATAGGQGGTAPDDDDGDLLQCPKCGTEVEADDNFCRSCGADVAHLEPGGELSECPACGADVRSGDNFCRQCGEDLDAHRPGRGNADRGRAGGRAAGEDAAGEPEEPTLVLVVRNREIQVTDGETVGREVRSVIMDTGGDEEDAVRVHREHVQFDYVDGQFHLVDLGRNPTVVNGESLEQGDRVPVSPGDRIELSNVAKIRVQDA